MALETACFSVILYSPVQVEVFYSTASLLERYTLLDVANIYGWKRVSRLPRNSLGHVSVAYVLLFIKV